MRKFFAALMLCVVSIASYAYDFANGLYLGGGVDFVANYLWRGQNLSTASAQPTVSFGYQTTKNGINHNVGIAYWGSYGTTIGNQFYGEADLSLSYFIESETTTFGVILSQYYYCDKSRYFYYKNDFSGNTTNVGIAGQLTPYNKYPFTIYFETMVFGYDNDGVTLNSKGEAKSWYSTYVELSYPIDLPHEISLTPKLGFSPHKSLYNGYSQNFCVNNLEIDCSKSFEFDLVSLNIFAQVAFNFYDCRNFAYNKNFHWNVGVGISI